MGFLDFIKSKLVPESTDYSNIEPQKKSGYNRRDVLNALKAAFINSLEEETTSESMLCHTFYKVYIHENYYNKISAGFHKTCEDAVKVFVKELKKRASAFPDFLPFSNRWEFHLIKLTKDTLLDESDQAYSDDMITIMSALWASKSIAEEEPEESGERQVLTMHEKNSMRDIPKGFNYNVLQGLIAAEKDKAVFRFTLDSEVLPVKPIASPNPSSKKLATIKISGGTFVDGPRSFPSYPMTSENLKISGKNDKPSTDGTPVLRINSDSIMCPHVEIKRDNATKTFKIMFRGPGKLNERDMGRHLNEWVVLPLTSSLMLGDFDLEFKA